MRRLQVILFLIPLVGFFAEAARAFEISHPLIVEHGPRNSRKIALTFDACPTSKPDEFDEKVIDILVRENVPSTLFLSGRWAEKNQERVRLLAGIPQFEIADHSYYHPHMLQKDDARDIREFARTQSLIRKLTGKTPRFFRPPFGEVDDRLASLAQAQGLVTIQYDIASGDPDPALSPEKMVRSILHQARGGSIIVFHMNRNGVHTGEVLPGVIAGLREKGYTLTTVGDLLQDHPAAGTETAKQPAMQGNRLAMKTSRQLRKHVLSSPQPSAQEQMPDTGLRRADK